MGDGRVTVLLDVRQPQAYLALAPAARLAVEDGIDVDFLPVVVAPLNAPSTPGPDDDRPVIHRRARSRALAREIETYAAAQGLVLREYYRAPNPSALNLAWLWVRERQPGTLPDFLTEAFRAYWALELDVSSSQDVAVLCERCGLDVGALEAWRAGPGAGRAEALAEELREKAPGRAPAYLVGDEVFVGRQHLPMIRWILGGRSGRGPI